MPHTIQVPPLGAAPFVLVAFDRRLITASEAERLKILLDPGTAEAADVPAFLARL